MVALGLRLHGGLAPAACVELAREAEVCGFSSVWFAENPFERGVLPAASASAVATTRMRVGIGVFNPYMRHPTLIAMEMAALNELAQGRAALGIGSGVAAALRRIGVARVRTLGAVRDAVQIVRALLRGEEVSYAGDVFSLDRVRLGFPVTWPDMPILTAGRGDKSIQMCAEIGDGLMISNMCPPEFTRHAAAILQHGRAKETHPIEIVQYLPCACLPDGRAARDRMRMALADMLKNYWALGAQVPAVRAALLARSTIAAADMQTVVDKLEGGMSPVEAVDDRFVEAYALAGTAQECVEQAAAYTRAGTSELVLSFAGGQPIEQMRYLSGEMARHG